MLCVPGFTDEVPHERTPADCQYIGRRVPEVDETTVTEEFHASVPLIKNEISERDGLGTLNPRLIKATWDLISGSMQYPQDKIDPGVLIDRSFLPAR
jgi:NitT/TauT family transport system substrate-binding protein